MKYFIDTHDKTKGSFPTDRLTEEEFFAQFDALEQAAHKLGVGAHAAHVNLKDGKAFCFMCGPDEESIRKAHEAVHFPYDSITEVKRVTGADMRIQPSRESISSKAGVTESIHDKSMLGRFGALLLAALLTTVSTSRADEAHGQGSFYQQINLVSDQPNTALVQDTNLVNAWGMSFGPTSPFWVNNAGSGRATLYAITNDALGAPHVAKQSLEVRIPGQGSPTGQVFNNTTNFRGNAFLFVSTDGVISGWRGALGTTAEVLAARSGAAYTGVTILSATNGNSILLAANFAEGTVDAYDGDVNFISQFSDPDAPAGYAPFNVRAIEGVIYVTFARRDAAPDGDVAGRGRGLINILDLQTLSFHRFITGSDAGGRLRAIDAPWGVAVAPSTFGKHAGQLLVGNFGSGTIMAFDERGHFQGLLKDASRRPIVNNGLWSLVFGSGNRAGVPETLYFTAGPDHETHGLVGSLEPATRQSRVNDNRAPEVPEDIAVPEGSKVHFHGFGIGVQIYTWDGASWGTAVPEATLFDDEGNVVATHFVGPTWQSNSGSVVRGAVILPTVTVDPESIPWLLLKAVTADGPGIFDHTSFIQRVNTVGGKAPSVAGSAIGEVARVPYSADYFFFRETNR